MTDNVTPLRPALAPTKAGSQLADGMASTVKMFEEDTGVAPTGAVWIIFDDEGSYRVGWEARGSRLPATALLGMATRALLDGPPPRTHD